MLLKTESELFKPKISVFKTDLEFFDSHSARFDLTISDIFFSCLGIGVFRVEGIGIWSGMGIFGLRFGIIGIGIFRFRCSSFFTDRRCYELSVEPFGSGA
jgi:hypothetical protein